MTQDEESFSLLTTVFLRWPGVFGRYHNQLASYYDQI